MTVTDLGFEQVEAAADAASELGAVDLDEVLSYEQIAQQLSCSPQGARQHVSRGLRNLRRRWEKQP